MINVVIAEDQSIVRRGLCALLDDEDDIKVIGEAADGIEAVHSVKQLHPDVLVLDLALPGISGIDAADEIHRRFPDTHILMLTMHSNDVYVLRSFKAGVDGYILKEESPTALVDAVRSVAKGEKYLSPRLSTEKISLDMNISTICEADQPHLTIRECEILDLVADGLTSSGIAEKLSISVRTVDNHRANIIKKLGLRSKVDLVRYAMRERSVPSK